MDGQWAGRRRILRQCGETTTIKGVPKVKTANFPLLIITKIKEADERKTIVVDILLAWF